MKKIFLSLFLSLACISFAYTSEDTSNAHYLADQGIITKQTVTSKYRLDDKILRQEVIGMALKIKWVTLPENYTCKKYFADATKNDWICRAVELAADNGIIARGNKYANPGKSITRAEALAMVMKAGWITIDTFDQDYFNTNFHWLSDVYWTDSYKFSSTWMRDVFFSYMKYVNIDVPGQWQKKISDSGSSSFNYRIDSYATRAEVFAFARNIITESSISDWESLFVDAGDLVKIQESGVTTWKYYKSVEFSNIYKCQLETNNNTVIQFLDNAKIQSTPVKIFKNFNMIWLWQVFEMAANWWNIAYFSNNSHSYTLAWVWDSNGGGIDYCMKAVSWLSTLPLISLDVLRIYYHNLGISWDKQTAYTMRSPAGVSLETFESWYTNTESVTFREDTLKDLWNNTYEFLVDMVESGKKSTYKVKSKVNLEKFTIDNISSVKQ